ncbi:MAG TPA: hypothetical protein VKA03_03480 [Methylovirgula sp.]|nr:hypothetical protein [Methylovirgula sp.]
MIQIKAPALKRQDTKFVPKHPLIRDVMIVTGAKLMVIIIAAWFLFGEQRPRIDAGAAEARLIGTHAVSLLPRGTAP